MERPQPKNMRDPAAVDGSTAAGYYRRNLVGRGAPWKCVVVLGRPDWAVDCRLERLKEYWGGGEPRALTDRHRRFQGC